MSFGFKVYNPTNWADEEPQEKRDEWVVSLPHQCDNWEIVGEYSDGATQDAAIQRLEEFISEAQEALSALRGGREFP